MINLFQTFFDFSIFHNPNFFPIFSVSISPFSQTQKFDISSTESRNRSHKSLNFKILTFLSLCFLFLLLCFYFCIFVSQKLFVRKTFDFNSRNFEMYSWKFFRFLSIILKQTFSFQLFLLFCVFVCFKIFDFCVCFVKKILKYFRLY